MQCFNQNGLCPQRNIFGPMYVHHPRNCPTVILQTHTHANSLAYSLIDKFPLPLAMCYPLRADNNSFRCVETKTPS